MSCVLVVNVRACDSKRDNNYSTLIRGLEDLFLVSLTLRTFARIELNLISEKNMCQTYGHISFPIKQIPRLSSYITNREWHVYVDTRVQIELKRVSSYCANRR